MLIEDSQLNKFIIDSNLVSRADFEAAKKEATKKKVKVGEILVNSGKITEDNMRRMQAYVLGISFVDLKERKIPFEILSLIPEPVARRHNIVAFKKLDGALEVAMLDVTDLSAIDFIKKKVKLKILPRLTDVESIKESLLQYQKGLKAEFGDLIQKESKLMKQGGGDASAVRIVDTLLKHAVVQNASDIHFEPQENEFLVRYRIDGLLHDAMLLPKTVEVPITSRIKTLSGLKLNEKRLPQEGRFRVDMIGEKISFRVSLIPTSHGEKTVMRLLRENISGFTLEYLAFHGDGLDKVHSALARASGMILVAGPAGSGKTTTLYTILDILNRPDVSISTIEDPVEYQMKRINQTQVNSEIGFTFASGLRTLVRQDPDVIMIGEIRDHETASLAVNASLTGHLVLSALPAKSASAALLRLSDMNVEPSLLASTLTIVIAQRLARKLSESKEAYFLTKAEVAQLKETVDLDRVLSYLKAEKITKETEWEKIPFWKPVHGKEDDGFKGRVGIHEVLKVTPTIKELLLKDATTGQIESQAKKEGMMTLAEDGIYKCVQGQTTIEEVFRVIAE